MDPSSRTGRSRSVAPQGRLITTPALRPLLRLAYRVAHAGRATWWRVARPHIHGAKVVVLDDAGRVLLIRHSYKSSELFMLPGGGIARGEDPAEGARREVREEVGCGVHDLRLHGYFLDTSRGARNHVHIFVARTDDVPVIDGVEIVEARFFPMDALPPQMGASSRRRVIEVRDGLPAADAW